MSALLGAFLVEVGLVTYRDVALGGIQVKKGKQSTAPLHAPLPSLYTSVIVIYGGLSLLPRSMAPLPAMVGWGFVVATFLNLFDPGAANNANKANQAMMQGLTTAPPNVGSSATKTAPKTTTTV